MSKDLETPQYESPVRHVMRFLPAVAMAIAPEKAQQWVKSLGNVSLYMSDKGAWEFKVTLRGDRSEVEISRKAMEFLWAAAYGHVVIYAKLFEGRREEVKRVFSLTADPILDAARRLLVWAYQEAVQKEDSSWPELLPRPVENPPAESFESVADELSLVAAGVLLHHELAHHYLRHEGGLDSLDAERDADNSAVDWALGGLDERDPRFRKRSLGIALAYGALTAVGIHTGSFGGTTHPRIFDRLMSALARHITDPNHPTWAFVLSLLKLHLDQAGMSVGDTAFATFRDAVESYVDILASAGL